MAQARLIRILVACGLSVGAASAVSAQPADFFAGKTVDFYIGYEPGAGYDIYARLMAEHIARFLPGHPTIVPRNMPGAASMRVMAYLQQVAKKDGTASPAQGGQDGRHRRAERQEGS